MTPQLSSRFESIQYGKSIIGDEDAVFNLRAITLAFKEEMDVIVNNTSLSVDQGEMYIRLATMWNYYDTALSVAEGLIEVEE